MIETRPELGRNNGENEMAKVNKNGWVKFLGGETPVDGETLVDIIYRGEPDDIEQDIHEGIPAYSSSWHFGGKSKWDVLYYRVHTVKKKDPQQMTAEEIRAQYMENLSSIDMLHTKNAALVDELRKLGFDFHETPKEPQEDMSDPSDWRVGDELPCLIDCAEGKVYMFSGIDKFGRVGVVTDDEGCTKTDYT